MPKSEDLTPQWQGFSVAELQTYRPKKSIRFVTATALFDGHDASINIMRRLLQYRGAEIIHLGHNRAAHDIVKTAIDEDVQAVAISSYQGGHMELFAYLRELLDEAGRQDVKLFGGGGGVIVPREIRELEELGVTKIYSPEDGQVLGLDGMIGHMLKVCDFSVTGAALPEKIALPSLPLARCLSYVEQGYKAEQLAPYLQSFREGKECASASRGADKNATKAPVLGITGTGGAGKSSLTDELLLRFLYDFSEMQIGILCIDPSKRKTGGALLGDRIRMNQAAHPRVFLRSLATRGSGREVADATGESLKLMQKAGFDLILIETSGIGQGDAGITDFADVSLYVMTPEYGAATQLEKIDMLDYADVIAVNKYERRQGPDAVRDIRTQLRRSRFSGVHKEDEEYPVYGTIASRFNDDGVSGLFAALVQHINKHMPEDRHYKVNQERPYARCSTQRDALIPAEKTTYLHDIARTVRSYHDSWRVAKEHASKAHSLAEAADTLASLGIEDEVGPGNEAESNSSSPRAEAARLLRKAAEDHNHKIPGVWQQALVEWDRRREAYQSGEVEFKVRSKTLKVASSFRSLSGLDLPKVAIPAIDHPGERLAFIAKENLPGFFPYTSGLFPFRRTSEDPKRQFAGEGGPARTNKRFHYLCKNDDAKRLSTAFDSVTLYGADPDRRPDIYGKVGESGVSIATLADMKKLFQGFDLCAPSTSVSMTINGPAPMILAMFLNTAIDQQLERAQSENGGEALSPEQVRQVTDQTLQTVRGTVQADILKEDQAQNTCIFSTEFALKLMGDVQEYFIDKSVRNYYSVSISGYHIAEAGANPITQLAFTLANGFTYVEYYLSRGLDIDKFAPNLSFFFSNGLDPEYGVLGRVARRIWAIAMRDLYGANERSQKLKYHIQTSGRSLHAQEMAFNDIRTTLQALMALQDNCNSLHTNAYDEAVTTPTEESVRRAMAIQMIINREYGLNGCENLHQGSHFMEELTDLVEEAVLKEFESLSQRGGVLGAMETQYQRTKIQEESLHYEHLKHTGELPIIGVNTFRNPETLKEDYVRPEVDLIRASYEEKDDQLARLQAFQGDQKSESNLALARLAEAVIQRKNVFAELMRTVRCASLGQISETLYRVGGAYRRAM